MSYIDSLVSLIAPSRCLECGMVGRRLCVGCRLVSLSSLPSRCYRCHAATKQSQVCSKCRKVVRLHHVWMLGEYNETLKKLIDELKFERGQAVAAELGEMIADNLPLLPSPVVVPLPTTSHRRRVRGYDQAVLIARSLARNKGWQYVAMLERRGSHQQRGVSRSDRFTQAAEAYAINPRKIDTSRSILLVDDVTTSGASLEAAARLLWEAGARDISAVVVAEAVD